MSADESDLRARPDAADRHVNDFFTSTGDGKAQSYEPRPAATDSGPEEAIMRPWRRAERARYADGRAILSALSRETVAILEMVYGHGTGGVSDELRRAMTPTWGHGSFVRLAVRQPRAVEAWTKRHGSDRQPTSDEVLSFLVSEATSAERLKASEQLAQRTTGQQKASFLSKVRNDCEPIRTEALFAFEAAHREYHRGRVSAQETARQRELDAAVQQTARAREKRDARPECLRWSAEERARLEAAARARIEELEAAS